MVGACHLAQLITFQYDSTICTFFKHTSALFSGMQVHFFQAYKCTFFKRINAFINKRLNTLFVLNLFILCGRNDGIRTHDLLVPNQTHYQAVLRPEMRSTNASVIITQKSKRDIWFVLLKPLSAPSSSRACKAESPIE